jgi:hypothetical protein
MAYMEDNQLASSEFASRGKQSYSPPQIFGYGTLREITLTVGMNGNMDGGTMGTERTAP